MITFFLFNLNYITFRWVCIALLLKMLYYHYPHILTSSYLGGIV
jgi:hypothetical protein